jgi:hypothetical protein
MAPSLFKKNTKLNSMVWVPRANYTDRATAACRRSDCQLVRIEGATWSAWRIPPAVLETLTDASKEVGLEINIEKTKYMMLSHH